VLLFVARQVVAEVDYSIAQISLDGRKVSFLNYKNFDKDAHAELLQSIRVHLPSASYAIRDYSSSDNPPILHRKEAFVDPLYRYFIDFAALTRQEEGSWSSIATGNRLQERMASLAERETSTDRRPPDTRQERWCREQRKILKSGDSAITKFDRARIWQLSVAVLSNFGQCATAVLADTAIAATPNQQVADSRCPSRVRIPPSPPETNDLCGFQRPDLQANSGARANAGRKLAPSCFSVTI
jgi:hypothetical protein